MKSVARSYLDLTEVWDRTDKTVVIDNIERVFGDSGTLRKNKDGTRINALSEITNTDKNTVRAWMNQSRTNVKIPLLKLCMIAEALYIDVYTLLTDRGSWRDNTSIDNRLLMIYEKLRMNQYYKVDGWDIDSFVQDLHKLEEYGDVSRDAKVERLVFDCWIYFNTVVGIEDSGMYDRIKSAAIKVCKG